MLRLGRLVAPPSDLPDHRRSSPRRSGAAPVGAALLRGAQGLISAEPDGGQPASLPAVHAAPGRVHPGRPRAGPGRCGRSSRSAGPCSRPTGRRPGAVAPGGAGLAGPDRRSGSPSCRRLSSARWAAASAAGACRCARCALYNPGDTAAGQRRRGSLAARRRAAGSGHGGRLTPRCFGLTWLAGAAPDSARRVTPRRRYRTMSSGIRHGDRHDDRHRAPGPALPHSTPSAARGRCRLPRRRSSSPAMIWLAAAGQVPGLLDILPMPASGTSNRRCDRARRCRDLPIPTAAQFRPRPGPPRRVQGPAVDRLLLLGLRAGGRRSRRVADVDAGHAPHGSRWSRNGLWTVTPSASLSTRGRSVHAYEDAGRRQQAGGDLQDESIVAPNRQVDDVDHGERDPDPPQHERRGSAGTPSCRRGWSSRPSAPPAAGTLAGGAGLRAWRGGAGRRHRAGHRARRAVTPGSGDPPEALFRL